MSAAGLVVWLGCAVPTLLVMSDGRLAGWHAATWWLAFLCFGVAWLWLQHGAELGTRWRFALLILEFVAATAMVWLGVSGTYYLSAAMFIFIASQLPHFFAPAAAWLWLAGQSVLLTALLWHFERGVVALSTGAAFAGFFALTMHRMLLMRSEQQARLELAEANSELHAARNLLAEHSRAAERLRISRDLHDTLGHHLTALSIQLEVAARRSEGTAAEHIREAHAIARLLLSDVRNVVSQLRLGAQSNLGVAIRAIATNAAGLAVHLEMPTPLHVDHDDQAEALLRGVQEIVTNTTRHAHARNLWIRIETTETELRLRAHDDGRGAADLRMGNGLTGMSERFERCAGRVKIHTAAGDGFRLDAYLPRAEAAA